jgi:hypothetical protein
MANSPYLSDLERVILWLDGGREQPQLFARSSVLPKLQELHLRALHSTLETQEAWVKTVNEGAGRSIATVSECWMDRFPFAADFAECYGFLVGKLPDGTQLFAYADQSNPIADGWLFHPDGTRREPFVFEFPAELVWSRDRPYEMDCVRQILAARKAYLAERIGFIPAFIRVENWQFATHDLGGPSPWWELEECWGHTDNPTVAPEEEDYPGGNGERTYRAVRDGAFHFDFGNDWWCDRTGQVTST